MSKSERITDEQWLALKPHFQKSVEGFRGNAEVLENAWGALLVVIRNLVIRNFVMSVGALALILLSGTAPAQQVRQGTAAEAKAMLQKTIAAVKANKTKALEMIAKGEGGFLDGDIYPFCFNTSDGKIHPFPNPNAKALFGKDERTLKDTTGKNYGKDAFDAAQKPEGQITEVHYLFTRPGDTKPSQKVSFVTRIGELGCGVGYYK